MPETLTTDTAVTIPVVFRDSDGELVDPVVVVFTWKTPAAVTDTYTYETDDELVRDSAGCYHVDLELDETGRWRWKWKGDGVSVTEGYIDTRAPEI